MPRIDKATLRNLANAASKGPWREHRGSDWRVSNDSFNSTHHAEIRDAEGKVTCLPLAAAHDWRDDPDVNANAAYIVAVNPSVMLELLDEIETLSKDALRYRAIRSGLFEFDGVGLEVTAIMWRGDLGEVVCSTELDAAVDAAMNGGAA